jgi:SM-20-related protein
LLRARAAADARRVSEAPGEGDGAAEREICDGLAERGFAVAPQFLARAEALALRAEGERRRAAGELHAARVGRGESAQRDAAIRSDEICWLDAARASAPERALLARLDALRLVLNRALYLGLAELEAHYSRYGPGAGYARHLDRFRDDDARAISLVLYLNDAWRGEDGGALRVFASPGSGEPALTFAPLAGTLVAMRSDTIEHEVALAGRERWSVAGWLRRRPAVPSAR